MNLMVMKEFIEITCANCGCLFALTQHYQNQKRKNGGDFNCPNGHINTYGETENDRLRKQLAIESSKRADMEHQVFISKKKLDRVSKGVCPNCNRCFQNILRHMKTKHSDKMK